MVGETSHPHWEDSVYSEYRKTLAWGEGFYSQNIAKKDTVAILHSSGVTAAGTWSLGKQTSSP